MSETFAHVLGVDPRALLAHGACNLRVERDNRFYIDSRLLNRSLQPEMKGATADFDRRFDKLLVALQQSRAKHDQWWKQAIKVATFAEPPGLFLGYGIRTANGRGVGPVLAREMVESASKSLELGKQGVALFELFVILDSGIGHDRLGDVVASVIYPRLLRYSQRVYKSLGVKDLQEFLWDETVYRLPFQSDGKRPYVLTPRDILAYLPHGKDHQDVVRLCENSQRLRDIINARFGEKWKAALTTGALRRAVLEDQQLGAVLARAYRRQAPKPYDFSEDPKGLQKTVNEALALVRDRPLDLRLPQNPTRDEFFAIVHRICTSFAHHVEHGGSTKLLWVNGKPRPERYVQQLFKDIAKAYCDANNLDLSPETNAGRGAVDFKVSRGAELKALVEIKLVDNKKLEEGYTAQLAIYGKAENTESLLYLIVDFGLSEKATQRAQTLFAKTDGPKVVLVDARIKPTASKSIAPTSIPALAS
jgi:hypothetical protein